MPLRILDYNILMGGENCLPLITRLIEKQLPHGVCSPPFPTTYHPQVFNMYYKKYYSFLKIQESKETDPMKK